MEKINSIKLDFDGNVSGNINFVMDRDSARVLEVEIGENFTDYKADLLIEQSDIVYKIKSFSEDSKLRFSIPILKSGLAKFQIRIYKNDKVLHSNYFKTVVKNTLDSDFWSIESENIETSNIDLSKYILKEELESLDIFVKKDEIIDYSREIEEITYKLKELSEKKADITLEDLSSILSDYVKFEEVKDYSKEIKDLRLAISNLDIRNITDEEINELISKYLSSNGVKDYSNDIDELKRKMNDVNYDNEIETINGRLNDIEDYADLKAEIKELKNTIRTLNQGGISKYSEFDSDRIALVNTNGTVNTSRVQVHTGEGNNRIFRIYYNKPFSKPPVILATLNTRGNFLTTSNAFYNGGNAEYFLVRVNYVSDLVDISYQAYVIGD